MDEGELLRGTTDVYETRMADIMDSLYADSRCPGKDGSYKIQIAYAAAQDAALIAEIRPEMRQDMTDLLHGYFLAHTHHNTSQACMDTFLQQWRENKQVPPDFR